ncbi:MAG: 2-oxo acid dehydrogenase subunit E2 [Oscillospiraceae bacterium]|nr:2-oxo acid dehydrogenase subunit E2 [Oscillospiraceae bacterium]
MAHTIHLPQIGISEESAVLTAWHVQAGGAVRAGDPLFSLETGKSAFDVASEHGGTVLAFFAAEGDEVAVGAPVCAIGEPGEEIALPETAAVSSTEAVSAIVSPDKPPLTAPVTPTTQSGISPRAKALAAKLGADPSQAIPTGPEGRVIERDIRALAAVGANSVRPPQPGGTNHPAARGRRPSKEGNGYTDQALSNMRKIIAKAMTASLQNTAQLTHTASFDATNIQECRKRFKADPAMSGITLGDIVLYAVTRVLPRFPALNAHLLGDTLRVFDEVNLAVAVDTERGLMVPVLTGASEKTLPELSAELKALAGQCRTGSVSPALLTGGSFTVSNLGQFGIESFTPILNAPQTGILGVNRIVPRVKVVDGCIGSYPAMTLSLTYDHRALDGAPASRFLQALCEYLESFTV